MQKHHLSRIVIVALVLGLCAQPALADASAPATPAPKLDKDKKPQPGFIKQHEAFVAIAKKGDVDVLFLGDSITAGWRGAGKEVWAKNFAPLKAANFGIGGDRTQHVLWRITNGELDGIKPRLAVLMIGTNNVGSDKPEAIAEGVTAIVKTIREKSPETKVLLLAVFPRGKQIPNPQNDTLIEVNKTIAKLDDGKNVRFLDIGPKFMKDGQLPMEISPDYVHLSAKGYDIWAEAILPLLNEMLGKK
jgi:lysophospholipase L1-like esterase